MADVQDKSRREFIAYSSMAAAALAVAAASPASAPPAHRGLVSFGCRDDRCLRDFTMDDFSPMVGQTFRIAVDGRATSVQLLRVTAGDSTPIRQHIAARSQPFSLIFTGDHQESLASAIHALYHPSSGPLKIFLSPIGARDPGQPARYQAVFA